MDPKRIFILNGHPAESSLSRLFTETYAKAATEAGHDARVTHLHDLDFDMDYELGGYASAKPLEPDLEKVLSDLEWCGHFVMATPLWWGGLPAKLKGLIDRAFLPGRAFDPRNPNALGLPAPLLTGRTARVILTSDTPSWFLRLVYGNALIRQLKGQVLGFVGFKPVKFTQFAGASDPKDGMVERWREAVRRIGAQGV